MARKKTAKKKPAKKKTFRSGKKRGAKRGAKSKTERAAALPAVTGSGMKVLMVASEVTPFVKTGGLADVLGALPPALRGLGLDVRLLMPRYYSIDKERWGLRLLEGPLGVPAGFGEQWCGVFEGRLPGTNVPVYFLDHEELFGREGVYGNSSGEFIDNALRFTVLSRGAFQLCRKLGWFPDIIHSHDWPAALAPVYLNTWERRGDFENTAGVLTIHNLAYQGWFPKEEIVHTQLDWDYFHGAGFEFFDQLNFLKAGITNADLLTTVSPTYAREIQTPEYGCMLEGLLRRRSNDLFGVLNGIDYGAWNPANDSLIPANYDSENPSGKAECKAALQQEAGLEIRPDLPLIGMVSRLAEQKGFGALCGPAHGSLYSICADMNLQVVILGTGDAWCEKELLSLSSKLPNLSVLIRFDNRLAHLIEAGSDFFLMPSHYEPCGLNQMYSMAYGTLPIVRRTGGLADTVTQYDQGTGNGTGFLFDELTPRAIYDTVGWAVWAWFNRPRDIEKMRRAAMAGRFDWESSARKYAELYVWAKDRRTGNFPRTW